MLAIGVFANRKDKGTENYYVGGRKQNPVTIMCLWVSCWIGGASVIGTSTKGYDMGITAVWYVGMTAMVRKGQAHRRQAAAYYISRIY